MTAALVTAQNVQEVVRKLSLLVQGTPIAVDCETTGLHPYQGDTLRGFSIAFFDIEGVPEGVKAPIVSYYIPVDYPGHDNLALGNLQLICGTIAGLDPLYVYHHAKFDLRFLRQLPRAPHGGVYFPVPGEGKLWDTKVVAWLMDENMPTGLKEQAAFHFGEDAKEEQTKIKALVKERGGWDKLTALDTAEYGAKDAELTLRLYRLQQDMLWTHHPSIHGDPTDAIEREMRIQGLLLRVEGNGILVDSGRLAELLEASQAECQGIEDWFTEMYATNINSTKQLTALLYETLDYTAPGKTPGGKPSVNRAALEKLDTGDDLLIERLLRHRRLRKAISGYLVPITKLVAPDGRLHPTFWSMGTVTGRYSCSDPNLQTIPRGDTLVGVRDIFIAPDGYELWSYDLKAAEMRVMAGLSQDETLLAGVRSGEDLHGKLAERVFGPKYTGLQRRFSKNIGYGYNYGLTSPATAAKYIEGPNATKIASKILDGLKEMYPGVTRYMRVKSREAEKVGYVPIGSHWPGRYRRFVTESVRKPYPYTASNAVIQGSIAEAMKSYMLEVEDEVDYIGARMVLQVHDALVIEVPEGIGEKVGVILQEVADRLDFFDIPMEWDCQEWSQHE